MSRTASCMRENETTHQKVPLYFFFRKRLSENVVFGCSLKPSVLA